MRQFTLSASVLRACGRILCMALAAGLLGACATRGQPAAASPHYRVVGYDTARHAADAVDVDKLDVLIFAFATIEDGRVVLAGDAATRLRKLTALKATHPRLKVMISVGGWAAGGFSEAAGTAAGRQLFAATAARMVAAHDADGLDVDWEYPGNDQAGIAASPDDRRNFTLLLQAVRASLDRAGAAHGRDKHNHYLLTIASADSSFVDGIDLAAVEPYLDWFNLMTYDFNNSLTSTTGNHAGLFASDSLVPGARTTAHAVQQYLAAGVPADKLVIGVAFYGLRFDGVRARNHGLYQSYTGSVTAHPWPQLKADYIDKHGYERHWDSAAQAAWLWNAKTRSFVSYDDPLSIAAKAAYVRDHHLGGIMYWEASQDDGNQLLDAIRHGLP